MEQNTPKFRLRLNLFDTIVLILALVVGGVLLLTSTTSLEVISSPEVKTATYTIRLRDTVAEVVDAIEVGDQLEDAVKNLDLGQVVSVTSQPSLQTVLDEENLVYYSQPHPTYLNVDIVVTAPASMTEDEIILSSGYTIRGADVIYVRGPGYLGSGIVMDIDRGIAE